MCALERRLSICRKDKPEVAEHIQPETWGSGKRTSEETSPDRATVCRMSYGGGAVVKDMSCVCRGRKREAQMALTATPRQVYAEIMLTARSEPMGVLDEQSN
jgi:hypothetical protein